MLLSDIGEGSNALFCLTNRIQCCTTETCDVHSSWQFPNSSFIHDDSNLSFYVNRGYSSLQLNRKSNAVAPTGVFICRLPDEATGSGMNMYIGVYDDAGEGVLGILLCMSHYISTIRFIHCITVL